MFTGIVEGIGTVDAIEIEGTNKHFWLTGPFTDQLKIDQSLAHNGVCLTVVDIVSGRYKVTAIEETLLKTNLNQLSEGSIVNLERCLQAGGRFDGHIVQGHVDQTAVVEKIEERNGSWNFAFRFNDPEHSLVVQKGSVTINGVSLTVVDASQESCSVSIIPYTYDHTCFRTLKQGDAVNIEFDILGKYVLEAQRRIH